jgi:hypothetical protein
MTIDRDFIKPLGWIIRVAAVALLSGSALGQTAPAITGFPDAREPPTPGWKGPVFRLSQSYPTTLAAPENYPWKKFNPKTQPEDYLRAVLAYAIEGNDAVDWDGASNTVRKWYNAPWLHWGRNGREFIHGLTYERVSLPGELASTQTQSFQNWAVGYYNARGAYAIGQVWRDPTDPKPANATFPEGSVSVKLLFTQATVDQVPYLKSSKEWEANIYSSISVPTNPNAPREIAKLRLLQIDVAIKDSASAETGWIFGTFTYNGLLPGNSVWDRTVPIGLMWGNDPNLTVRAARKGEVPKEEWLNPSLDVPFQHLGWAGRLNGPVDNQISSCLSCHSTAQWPPKASLVPLRGVVPDSVEWMTWFRNIKGSTETFSSGTTSLDYSLQLASGISNFYEWKDLIDRLGGNTISKGVPLSELKVDRVYPVSRAGTDE